MQRSDDERTQSSFSILVHILLGEIDFGVEGSIHRLVEGDIISLEPNVPHDLHALQNSIVRLTLAKQDKQERVANAISS